MICFFREKNFSFLFDSPLAPRRGFFFYLTLGVSKELDPLTGMTVNLLWVDQWIEEFIQGLPRSSALLSQNAALFSQASALHLNLSRAILKQAQIFFSARAFAEGAQVVSLALREERGGGLHWEASRPDDFAWTSSHYWESFHPETGGLQRLHLTWRTDDVEEPDFFAESLLLLKTSNLDSVAGIEQNGARLNQRLGHRLGPRTFLTSIRWEMKEKAYDVVFP